MHDVKEQNDVSCFVILDNKTHEIIHSVCLTGPPEKMKTFKVTFPTRGQKLARKYFFCLAPPKS